MAVDKGRQGHEATETSPLLRPDLSNEANGIEHAIVDGDGTLAGSSTPGSSATAAGADEGGHEPLPAGNGGDEVTREGIPEMAKRLHILLPAIGIGIFLCALDQLLAVATVSILHLILREMSRFVSNPPGLLCFVEGGLAMLWSLEPS